MADYGAEVIKVEPPGTGDPSRLQGPFPDDVSHLEKSGLFLHLNTNKKGVTLDLDSSRGQDLFKLLLQDSHILVESGRPGRMDSLGLGYDVLRELRHELVMTSVTPFGQTGPDSQYEFTELTVFATGGGSRRRQGAGSAGDGGLRRCFARLRAPGSQTRVRVRACVCA